jgi:hypothetical protein
MAMAVSPVLLWGCGQHPIGDPGTNAPAVSVSETDAIVASSASTAPATTTESPTTTTPANVGTSNSSTQLYSAITTLIDRPDGGPKLCLGGQLDSAPPICGDVPVVGLDWSQVTGAIQSGEVTWMERAVVTGTYDGSSLTLSEPPRVATDAELRSSFDQSKAPPPCTEPSGGWAADGARFPPGSDYNEYIQRVDAYTSAAPDWGGISQNIMDDESTPDISSLPEKVILVEWFTGNIETHETELQAIWPGALCVASSTSTTVEMEALAARITQDEAGADSLEPVMRGSALVDYSTGVIRVFVPVADAAIQAAFDAKYGTGAVVVTGALQPAANA